MILGVVAPSDHVAYSALERLACGPHGRATAFSVRRGVAIAAWSDFEGASYDEESAYIGTMAGSAGGLAGDFASVARTSTGLRLARARFAGRPLFWIPWSGGVVGCSRLLPLLELSRDDIRVNADHIVAMFDTTLRRSPLPVTAARRVRANTFVDIAPSGVTTTTPGVVQLGPELNGTVADLAKVAAERFQQAVERQCAGPRNVAVFAGGGVDSGNLLAAAVRSARARQGARVTPIAFDFDGGPGDDRPYLVALSRFLEIEPVRVRPADAIEYANRDFVIDGCAHASGPGAPLIAAAREARRRGATRALVGDGCELLLDSDPAVFADYLGKHPVDALICASRFRGIGETRWRSIRRLAIAPLVNRCWPRFAAWRRRTGRALPSWMGPRLRDHFAQPRSVPPRPAVVSQRQRVLDLASSDVLMSVREHISRWEQATELSFNLPYCDDEYVRFLARIPSRVVFGGNRERGLLRESMAGLVPDEIRYRRDKADIRGALDEFLSAAGGLSGIRHLTNAPVLTALGFIDGDAFRRTVDEFASASSRSARAWFTVWSALSAEAFLQWFRQFTGREPLS